MAKSYCTLLMLVIVAAAMCRPVRAGETPDPPHVGRETIDWLIGELSQSSYEARETAQKLLIAIGPPAVAALREAMDSDDPETLARIPAILKAIDDATRETCVKVLADVPLPFRNIHLYLSPDGEHVAYIRRKAGAETLVHDGVAGPAWDSILYVGPYSHDGKRLPYQARRGDEHFIVFVGEEDRAIATIGNSLAVYSPDCRHWAYIAQTEKGKRIVRDGNEGPVYKQVDSHQFSPDGKHLAAIATDEQGRRFVVLDGRPIESTATPRTFAFSPDGKQLAFVAQREGRQFVVHDGVEGPAYPEAFCPLFSPDGKGLAYWARNAGRTKHSVIWNGRQVAELSGEPRLTFSPDGRQLACSTYGSGELIRIRIDGKAEDLAVDHGETSEPVFSPDGRHLACAVALGKQWAVCVDGRRLRGRYDPEYVKYFDGPVGGGSKIILDPPAFSDDGRHVYFKGFAGPPGEVAPAPREHFIVCDGIDGPVHDGLWIPDHFRNHAKRLRYVVLDGERLRLMELTWPTTTWPDAAEDALPPSG